MPPMPQAYLSATASRLILAGCRCRKTFESTPSARLRGVSSCFTRRTDFQTSVFSGALMVSLSSSVARAWTALAFASTLATALPPLPEPSPLPGLPASTGFSGCPLVSAMIRTSHVPEDGARIAELRRVALGPRVKVAQIDHNLPFRIQLHVRAIHGTRRRPLEVDALGVVTAAMARALELVLAGLPVGRASQVGADGRDHEDALGVAHHPNTVVFLKFGIDPEAEIRRVADQKFGFRLVERAREEEAQEHQEIDAQRAQHRRHHKTAAAGNRPGFIGVFGFGKNRSKRLHQ